MFDISWSELLIIGVVALIAIGPKELPGALRALGNWMGKIRRMASEFQGQFNEAMREAEMADIKKQVDDVTGAVSSYTNFDPMQTVQNEVDKVVGDPFGKKSATDTASVTTTDPGAVSPEAVPQSAPAPVAEFNVPPTDVAAAQPQPQPADAAPAPDAPNDAPRSKVGSG
ncbi:MAG: twin-arginine translocase subunit TatB [Alphaproteobacteria bacterium]|nr:twin-arginine translocase subunit TatB [Alphaproteobacteria bacterium]